MSILYGRHRNTVYYTLHLKVGSDFCILLSLIHVHVKIQSYRIRYMRILMVAHSHTNVSQISHGLIQSIFGLGILSQPVLVIVLVYYTKSRDGYPSLVLLLYLCVCKPVRLCFLMERKGCLARCISASKT